MVKRRHRRKCSLERSEGRAFRCSCGSWGKKLIRFGDPCNYSEFSFKVGNGVDLVQRLRRVIRKWRFKRDSRRASEALRDGW